MSRLHIARDLLRPGETWRCDEKFINGPDGIRSPHDEPSDMTSYPPNMTLRRRVLVAFRHSDRSRDRGPHLLAVRVCPGRSRGGAGARRLRPRLGCRSAERARAGWRPSWCARPLAARQNRLTPDHPGPGQPQHFLRAVNLRPIASAHGEDHSDCAGHVSDRTYRGLFHGEFDCN